MLSHDEFIFPTDSPQWTKHRDFNSDICELNPAERIETRILESCSFRHFGYGFIESFIRMHSADAAAKLSEFVEADKGSEVLPAGRSRKGWYGLSVVELRFDRIPGNGAQDQLVFVGKCNIHHGSHLEKPMAA
jgi:hypothetical protein